MVDQYTHIVDGTVQFKVTLPDIVVLQSHCYFIVVHDHSLLASSDIDPLSYSNFVNTLRDSI